MGKVFAVGVGPGASDHLTEDVKKIILGSDIILGYKYTSEYNFRFNPRQTSS